MAKMDCSKWPIFSVLDPEEIGNVKKICVFGSSGNEAIYITESDDVYAIGSNCSNCLGLGDAHSSFEPRKIELLCKKKITDIAFGSGPHVLAVSANGEVYSWGHNGYCQLGNGGSSQGLSPTLISTNLQGRKVVKVACGSHHSMALTSDGEVCLRVAISVACGQTSSMALMENGEVYGWGYNGNGQLGLGNNVNMPNPSRVQQLQNTIISQLVCGYAHTLALSDEGILYSWGANSYGQLGTGNKANQVAPCKVTVNGDRLVEVAASHYAHISAAMTETGKVYVWGQCRGQSITNPIVTSFTCTDDVFSAFAAPPVTWRTYSIDQMKGAKIAECIAKSFDDPYLYTDQVNLKPDEAIGLLDLANAYCELALKRMCEQIIKKGITVENVAMLYAAARKFEAKELEDFCFRFALNHMTAVTQTEAFTHLDESIIKEFIRKAALAGAFKF
ncbi:hypothetical protein KUTeg_012219 [Tegillarca granosa]|uniref:RCC1 and BTB domain-containing protein 1 n=1 Tax=Tegillarca granosa TaxID=220873 RepID=A0ABQ9EYW5_TEGGR|nr:hypothetical protein KUTeg_012219 [Tegillarca granosa]